MKSIFATEEHQVSDEREAFLHEVLDEHGLVWAALDNFAAAVHLRNVESGWWGVDEPVDRNTGELLMLVVSEIAEGMEGDRKNLQDDHLPQYKMLDVELADAVIRIMDIAGARGTPLGQIIQAKMAYNAQRADHKPENRALEGGKKY